VQIFETSVAVASNLAFALWAANTQEKHDVLLYNGVFKCNKSASAMKRTTSYRYEADTSCNLM
jgi:hypothetical protein